jgi:hypothetical protein
MTGIAELPLHEGHVPRWLAEYMKKLAKAIIEVIVEFYGPRRFVEYMSDPIWFQAFNNAIGMDWDSSGSTTVTIGIVRQVLDQHPELGVAVAGGKGKRALETPQDIDRIAERFNLPSKLADRLKNISRLSAKTDNILLQDGYTLYHHSVIVSEDGYWAVIQQGMNIEAKMARRYHWIEPLPAIPTLEPHKAIAAGRKEVFVIDLTSRVSLEARKAIVDLAKESPRKILDLLRQAYLAAKGIKPLTVWLRGEDYKPNILLKYYRPQLKPPRNLEDTLMKIREISPRTIEELIMVRGVGPAVVRSLALVAELIYGVPVDHKDRANSPIDPFRYAFIVGGKDGVPFPFRVDYARKVLEFLESVLEQARLDEKHKQRALERVRRLAELLPK